MQDEWGDYPLLGPDPLLDPKATTSASLLSRTRPHRSQGPWLPLILAAGGVASIAAAIALGVLGFDGVEVWLRASWTLTLTSVGILLGALFGSETRALSVA